MERRLAIKQVLIMAGGLALLPSCLQKAGKSTILLKNISIDLDQENLLAEIAETMIPKTDTPGARELKLHLFVLKMVDDCEDEKIQKQFTAGLAQLKEHVYGQFSKSFSQLSAAQQKEALETIQKKSSGAGSNEISTELNTFFQVMKKRTIQGYLNSQYVMTNLIVYELVPGRYNGYFPVKTV